MLGRFRSLLRGDGKSSVARCAAGALALVSAFGTLASLVLWIETGVIGAAIGFATTTATIYLAVLVLLGQMVPRRSPEERPTAKRAATSDSKGAVSSQR